MRVKSNCSPAQDMRLGVFLAGDVQTPAGQGGSRERRTRRMSRAGAFLLPGLLMAAIHPAMLSAQNGGATTSIEDQRIDALEQRLEEIQRELKELRSARSAGGNASQPAAVTAAPAVPEHAAEAPAGGAFSSSNSGEASTATAVERATPVQTKASVDAKTNPNDPHSEPFAFADFTWLTGNPRTKDTPYATKFFTPEIRADVNYTYDFNHPKDDTISGSSEIFRANEVQLTQFGVGGDFHHDNVRARLMTQFGLYSQTTPRNDASPTRGQWNLADAYRYVSEAYGGYHFNVQHGINVDAGIFMSYVGLFSYYQFDNWAYQPSYVSSNTPWFFNGVRVQWFPTAKLKIEPWFVNGWQSYGRFNSRPGIGG